MKNIAIIDCESQGASTSYSKIISISGILVSQDSLEILDKFNLFCKIEVSSGYIPDPYSLLVNRGLKKMQHTNTSWYEMMKSLHSYIEKWRPCIWASWNGISFDYVIISKNNMQSLMPIYATNTEGNEHSDFLPVARASKIFYPNSFQTNYSVKKNPIFKLDDLGPKNFPEIDKNLYHSAGTDCEITLKIMRKIKENAKPIFDSSLMTTSKINAKKLMEENKIFTTLFYFYGKARPACVFYWFDHKIFNWPMVYMLDRSPEDLMNLDYKSLKQSMTKPGKWIRALPLKHPIVLNASFSLKHEPFSIIGMQKLLDRRNYILDNKQFTENVSRAVAEIAEEKQDKKIQTKDLNPHDQLYAGGFEGINRDKPVMKDFQNSNSWEEKYTIISHLTDPRFIFFGKRLIYQNAPHLLPKKELYEIEDDIAHKVLSLEETRWTTIPMAEQLIDNMREQKNLTEEELNYINEVNAHIKDLRNYWEPILNRKRVA